MIPHNTEICVLRDAPTLTQAAAEQVVQHAASAVNSRGKFTVALAGGSSEKSPVSYTHLTQPTKA